MTPRDQILNRVRGKLANQAGRVGAAGVDERIRAHARNLIPQRAQRPLREQLDLFEQQVTALAGTVRRVTSETEVPAALADYLRQQNLPPRVKRAPTEVLATLPWQTAPLIEVTAGAAVDADQVSLTPAFCAVAETGTLVLQSSPETPTGLAFLPETHVVVLRASQMVGTYEEAFALTRETLGEGVMPRSFNFITGPSRTADIEQKIELGAHGPRRLHIILVEDVA
ncbi:MAG TPA: lactate utilization protein C [Kiloniellales bacterium]|nr:lactate utilization protein C [Kiloniellales bacterium]